MDYDVKAEAAIDAAQMTAMKDEMSALSAEIGAMRVKAMRPVLAATASPEAKIFIDNYLRKGIETAAVFETLEYAMGGPGFFDASGEVRITYAIPNGAAREVLMDMHMAGAFGVGVTPETARHWLRGGAAQLAAAGTVQPSHARHVHRGGAARLTPAGQTDGTTRYVMPVRVEPRTLRAALG